MTNQNDLYCQLFIDCNESKVNLSLILATFINGRVELGGYIKSKESYIHVRHNHDHNDPQYGKPIPWGTIDEFLYYKYFLDIFPKDENVNKNEYEKEIGNLLEQLWNSGYKAVAAYGYDENLPRNGGMGYDPNGVTKFSDSSASPAP